MPGTGPSPSRGEQRARHQASEGQTPAEELTADMRGRLVAAFHRRGCTDEQIAEWTATSIHTVARIRDGLGLPQNRNQSGDDHAT